MQVTRSELGRLIEQHGMEVLALFTEADEAKRQLASLGFDTGAYVLESNKYAAKLYSDLVGQALPNGPANINSEAVQAMAEQVILALVERPNLLGEIFILEGYITSLTHLRNTMISVIIGRKPQTKED